MYDINYHGNAPLKNFHFLVTGGAGFIGSNIVEYLLKYGAGKVTVLDNLATGSYDNIKPYVDLPNFSFVNGDIRDLDTCEAACAGVDYILHQAALGSVPRSLAHPDQTNATNVSGFLNMLIAAKESTVKRMVYASSSSVYGDSKMSPKIEENTGMPLSPYAVSKCTNELYAHVFHLNYGLEIMGLRYFNVFGPRQNPNGEYAAVIPRFIAHLMNGTDVFIDGDGEQTRDFTFVENAVQANIKALFTDKTEAVGQVFNIAVGEKFSVNQLYGNIRDILGVEASAKYRDARKGDVRNSLADTNKAQKLLGYAPEFRFYQGLEKTIAYFKEVFAGK